MGKKLWLRAIGVFIGLFMFVITIHSAIALSCDYFEGDDKFICEDISNADIPQELKEQLYSHIGLKKTYIPDHEFVYQWNTHFDFVEPPEDVEVYSGYWVENAWQKIIAVMPSVIENDTLLVGSNATLLSGFNYKIKEIPSNYESGQWPKNRDGDCRTEYAKNKNEQKFSIYVNGDYFGNEKLTPLTISAPEAAIQSNLDIVVHVNINHWKWKKYCARWGRTGCKRWEYKCEYRYTESKNDDIHIVDTLQVKKYGHELNANYSILDQYNGNTKFSVSADNETSVNLRFEDSHYQQFRYWYDAVYSLPPYYVLTLRAHPAKHESRQNIFFNGDELIVKNINNCQLVAWNHFEKNVTPCNLDYEDIDVWLETDKLTYTLNETIKVSLFPKDTKISVSYGNQSVYAENNVEFTAIPYYNKITAQLGSKSAEKLVYVHDGSAESFLINLSVFSLLNFCIFSIVKKCGSYFM